MFKKLKQKIEDEGTDLSKPSVLTSSRYPSQTDSSSSTPTKNAESSSSVKGSTESIPDTITFASKKKVLDLQQYQTSLNEKEKEIEALNERLVDAEANIQRIIRDNEQLVAEKNEMQSKLSVLESQSSELNIKNVELENNVVSLSTENDEIKLRKSHLENTLSELQDEHDALKHKHDLYVNKSSSESSERTSHISYLEERVHTLERRLTENELGGDERYAAVINERNELEKKLEESRQHLMEIKSNWSEKISNLERQISHLNKKIAEDTEEMTKLESTVAENENQLHLQIRELNENLKNLENLNMELSSGARLKDEEFENQRTEMLEIEKRLQEGQVKCKTLEEKLESLETNLIINREKNDTLLNNSKWEIEKLEEALREKVGSENLLQQQIAQLQEDQTKLKKDNQNYESEIGTLKSTQEGLIQEKEILAMQVNIINTTLEEKSGEVENSYIQSCELSNELKVCKQERDQFMVRNAELSHQIELFKQSNLEQERNNEEERKANNKKMGNDQENNYHEKIYDLEKTSSHNGETVDQLKQTILEMENQLSDKVKTIKLQQQRISDMKKTFQKELKMQGSNDSPDVYDKEPISLAPVMGKISKVQLNAYGHNSFNHKPSSLANKLDEINFKYLKHVMLKFMTSKEYEAQQLIKAIAMLLEFTHEEEQVVRETLEWKMSWFGSKPQFTKSKS